MQWHIISLGDEAFLYKIFQFLAMLGSPGTSLYGKLGLLGALIGLLLLLVQAVSSAGRQLDMGSLLIGVSFFIVMFGTTTSVELEDYHNGRTDIVSNVPMGTAILGTLVSQGGVGLLNFFEQGTAVPGHEKMSPDYALTALAASRSLTDGDLCASSSALCPFAATLASYMTDCVYPAYKGMGRNGQKGWWNGDPQIVSNSLDALKVDNQFTLTNDLLRTQPYGTPSDQSCSQTYTDIVKASTDPAITDAMASSVLASAQTRIPPNSPPGTATNLAIQALGSSYLALQDGSDLPVGQTDSVVAASLNQAQQNAQHMMMNATVLHAMTVSSVKGAVGPSDMANAAIVESAAQRRNVSFAAEQSLFGRTLNATMTFFEGVAYGLAPFVAFLIPMGAVGFKFFGRYLQLLLWIFLWLPLMSFVNLFEIMSVLRQMNALAPSRGNGPLESMVGILQTQYAVGDWIAMGGWLSTSVLGLSGLIVFGSIAAFQQIASAAHGPDSVDTSSLAPEVVSAASMVQSGAAYSSSGGSGLARTNAGDFSVSAASGYSASLSLRHSQIVSSLEAHGMSRSQAESATYSSAEQFFRQAGTGDDSRASISQGAGSRSDTSAGHSNDLGKIVATSKSADAGAEAHVGYSTPLSGITGLNAGVSAKASTSIGHKAVGQQSDTNSSSDRLTNSEEASAGRTHSISSTVNDGHSNTEGSTYSNAHSAQWNASLQKTLSDLKSYDVAKAEQSSFSAEARVDGRQIAAALPANSEAFGQVVSSAIELGGGSYYHDMQDKLERNFPDAQQRAAVAGMATLEHLSQSGSPEVRMEATKALIAGMEATNPLISSTLTRDATSILGDSSSIRDVQESTGGVGARVDGESSGRGDLLSQQQTHGGGGSPSVRAAVSESLESAEGRVKETYDTGKGAVTHDAGVQMENKVVERKRAVDTAGAPSILTEVGENGGAPNTGGSSGGW